LQHWLMD